MHRPLLLDISSIAMHPSDSLFQGKHQPVSLPVGDLYAAPEKSMGNSPAVALYTRAPIKIDVALHEIQGSSPTGAVECQALGAVDSVPAFCGATLDSMMSSTNPSGRRLATNAKMKIAAACHAPGKIASHNACVNTCDPSALTRDAIKPAESRRVQHKSTRHDRARYRHNCTVPRKAKRNGQSVPEAAGALM